MSIVEKFENVTVSSSRIEFTENDDWSCDLSPSPLAFKKTKMEDIDRERMVIFVGISLLSSLIVNWPLNVYAHKFK